MLNKNGLEVLDIGIDEETSLHEGLVTADGLDFLIKVYDKVISESEYNVACERTSLDTFFNAYNHPI